MPSETIVIVAAGQYPYLMPAGLQAALTESIAQHMNKYGLEQVSVTTQEAAASVLDCAACLRAPAPVFMGRIPIVWCGLNLRLDFRLCQACYDKAKPRMGGCKRPGACGMKLWRRFLWHTCSRCGQAEIHRFTTEGQ